MESTTFEHILIQSRITILDLLDKRGYNTESYRKLIGPELLKLVESPEALRMTLPSKQDPEKNAIVKYEITKNIKPSVSNFEYVRRMLSDPPESLSKLEKDTGLFNVDPTKTEVVVLYIGRDISDDKESPYDKAAWDAWDKHKFKIQFFPMNRLVCNPLSHVLQPKFEIVPPEEHEALKKEWFITNHRTQLPIIKFHVDMAARCLGLMPLDIVKITAASPTSGEYVKYRVCAL
jgi:DNA-directed RNA polymerase subunit H (RpoH/RPB5)